MIHVQHYLNHLPLQEREILICVLNKAGVGKSGPCESSGHTSLQPRVCLDRGPSQNVVGLLFKCSNFTDDCVALENSQKDVLPNLPTSMLSFSCIGFPNINWIEFHYHCNSNNAVCFFLKRGFRNDLKWVPLRIFEHEKIFFSSMRS